MGGYKGLIVIGPSVSLHRCTTGQHSGGGSMNNVIAHNVSLSLLEWQIPWHTLSQFVVILSLFADYHHYSTSYCLQSVLCLSPCVFANSFHLQIRCLLRPP